MLSITLECIVRNVLFRIPFVVSRCRAVPYLNVDANKSRIFSSRYSIHMCAFINILFHIMRNVCLGSRCVELSSFRSQQRNFRSDVHLESVLISRDDKFTHRHREREWIDRERRYGTTAHTAPDALRIFWMRKKSRREILMNLVNERIAVIPPIALL